ncbi:hypothetical protein [Planotetraspora phitsanulokensis]|uniref:Xylulose 5-phosphate/Fructose 6-phosphate phosphoketolase N-terminal domain-containing protein n=1 Tax=Planotetraspora phitsanulokensis TaxID=575192 RepID=A0A8J3UQE1_9ACTN|nr:hypothetical protein Pph01_77530 [Planotetraspora phitsanulokensis]
MHRLMAGTLDEVFDEIAAYKAGVDRRLPMVVLRTPKGSAGPAAFVRGTTFIRSPW